MTEQERLDGELEIARAKERWRISSGIRLMRDQVLVRLLKPERLSASRKLFLPSTAKRQSHELYEAEIIAVGPGVHRKDGKWRPVEPKPGEKVLCYWPAFDMEAIPEFGPDLRIVEEKLIQAVLEA